MRCQYVMRWWVCTKKPGDGRQPDLTRIQAIMNPIVKYLAITQLWNQRFRTCLFPQLGPVALWDLKTNCARLLVLALDRQAKRIQPTIQNYEGCTSYEFSLNGCCLWNLFRGHKNILKCGLLLNWEVCLNWTEPNKKVQDQKNFKMLPNMFYK